MTNLYFLLFFFFSLQLATPFQFIASSSAAVHRCWVQEVLQLRQQQADPAAPRLLQVDAVQAHHLHWAEVRRAVEANLPLLPIVSWPAPLPVFPPEDSLGDQVRPSRPVARAAATLGPPLSRTRTPFCRRTFPSRTLSDMCSPSWATHRRRWLALKVSRQVHFVLFFFWLLHRRQHHLVVFVFSLHERVGVTHTHSVHFRSTNTLTLTRRHTNNNNWKVKGTIFCSLLFLLFFCFSFSLQLTSLITLPIKATNVDVRCCRLIFSNSVMKMLLWLPGSGSRRPQLPEIVHNSAHF